MNGRLAGLFGALQGGTRRKPTYLNTGALVSWVYGTKIKDNVDAEFNLIGVTIKDVVIEKQQTETLEVFAGITGVTLNDPILFLDSLDTIETTVSIKNLILTDVVEEANVSDTVFVNMAISGVTFNDNVKVAGDLLDSFDTVFSLTNVLLEDV